jgi:hypothetical protein
VYNSQEKSHSVSESQIKPQSWELSPQPWEYLKDDIPVVELEGKVYLGTRPISYKHNYLIQFDYDESTKVLSARHYDGNQLLESIPHVVYMDRIYIEYDYYINTIVPLL